MTLGESVDELFRLLLKKHEEKEAHGILRILKEDVSLFKKDRDCLLSDEEQAKIGDIKRQLLAEVPIQQITQKAFFYGYEFFVNQNVLIPRPETEELVREIIAFNDFKNPKIIDIGTGSGCIAVSLKKKIPQANILALDASSKALHVAKHNAQELQADVNFKLLDFLDEAIRQTLGVYDIIVSNPPYIALEEKHRMDTHVITHEPSMALFTQNDPLIFYKTIVEFSKRHLSNKGFIAVEINEFLHQETLEVFQQFKTSVVKDMQGKPRIILAQWVD